jgi:hypothetical protein
MSIVGVGRYGRVMADFIDSDLRRDRMSTVRDVVDRLTDESLAADTEPVEGPGWPRPRSYPVRTCLRVVLNEEWEHRLYAERDLAVLAARVKGDDGR